jgi:hypothetical protein
MSRPTTELAHLFRALKAPAAARALPKLADRARLRARLRAARRDPQGGSIFGRRQRVNFRAALTRDADWRGALASGRNGERGARHRFLAPASGRAGRVPCFLRRPGRTDRDVLSLRRDPGDCAERGACRLPGRDCEREQRHGNRVQHGCQLGDRDRRCVRGEDRVVRSRAAPSALSSMSRTTTDSRRPRPTRRCPSP